LCTYKIVFAKGGIFFYTPQLCLLGWHIFICILRGHYFINYYWRSRVDYDSNCSWNIVCTHALYYYYYHMRMDIIHRLRLLIAHFNKHFQEHLFTRIFQKRCVKRVSSHAIYFLYFNIIWRNTYCFVRFFTKFIPHTFKLMLIIIYFRRIQYNSSSIGWTRLCILVQWLLTTDNMTFLTNI